MSKRLASCLVLSCEHASAAVPKIYKDLIPEKLLTTHFAYDIGAAALAKHIAKSAGVEVHCGTMTRLVIDLNRSLRADKAFSQYSKTLSDEQRQSLSATYYLPFRDKVMAEIERKMKRSRRVLHISVHSFTRQLHGEVRAADFGVLYDPKRPFEVEVADAFFQALAKERFRVRRNYPYRGTSDGHTTALRRLYPERPYAGIELEVCDDVLIKHRGEIQKIVMQALLQTI